MKTNLLNFKFTCVIITGLLLFLLPSLSFGQALTGTKYIPGDYSTISAALLDLNTNGVGTGGVVFNVAAGTTEAAVVGGDSIKVSGTASNRIVFQKDPMTTGANPLITAPVGTSTTVDGIFYIMGGSYITINGIDLQENALNTTTTTQMEFGYALVKRNATAPFVGCQNDTIKNCNITLNKANTVTRGIYANNHTKFNTTALTCTLVSDANSYNGFIGNTIKNVNTGIYVSGFAAAVSPYTLWDISNYIYGNSILDYAGSAAGYGIYMYYQSYNTISYNLTDNYNNGASGAVGATTTLYGIYNVGTTSGANPANPTIVGNTLKLTLASGSAGTTYGLYNYYAGGNNIVNSNIFKLITLGTTACTGTTYITYVYPSSYANLIQYNNNHFDSNTVNYSGTMYVHYVYGTANTTTNISNNSFNYFTRNLAAAATTYGYYCYGSNNYTNPSTVYNFNNNTCDSINNTTGTGSLYPMYYLSGGYTTNIYNNTVNRIYATAATGTVYGISPYYYATNVNMYNNTVSNMYSAGVMYGVYYYGYYFANSNIYNNTFSNLTTTGLTSSLVGFYVYYGGTASLNFYKNKIYSLSSTGSGGCAAQGMLLYNASAGAPTNMPMKIYNNLMSDFQAPNSTVTTVCVSGININYSSYAYAALIYDNTMYFSGTGGPNAHSSCVYVNNLTPPTVRMNNNIFINKLAHSGTGIASTYYRNGTALASYDNLSNGNLFYAGTPSLKNVFFYDGTNKDYDLSVYKSRVSPRDVSTSAENVTFLSTAPSDPNYLRPDSTVLTNIESGATNIAGITDDYSGRIRAGNAGYVGTGSSPDVGAFEGNYIGIPMLYDSCNADQNMNAVLSGKTNQVVLRMRIYTENLYGPLSVTKFKLNTSGTTSISNISNAKVFYTSGSSNFNATSQFGSVVAAPNGVFYVTGSQTLSPGANYFWITYDISASASLSNVVDARFDSVMIAGINRAPINGDPFGGTPISTPLSGSYTIGTLPYFTLAAAIADLNNKGLTSTVTLNVPAGFTEQAPIGGYLLGSTLLNSNLNSSNRLNIVKSGFGTNPLLFANTGTSVTNDGLFMIQGSDYVTINGIDLIDTNTVSATAQMEQGYGLVKLNAFAPFDGCQYDTIMNSTITLKRTNVNSRGIYVNNAVASDATSGLPITAVSDLNSYNIIMNDSVQNTNCAIVFGGFAAAAPFTLYDQSNIVSGCVITNYNGTYGLWMMNQSNNVASNNIIDNYNNGLAGAVGAAANIYGIYNSFGNTGSANPSNVTINNNYINLTQASASAGYNYNIYVYYSQGNLTINNNQIKWSSLGATAGSGYMYGLYCYPSSYGVNNIQINNNHIDSVTINNSTGYLYPIYLYGAGNTVDFSGNTFRNFTRNGGTTGGSYGFYAYGSTSYNTPGTVWNFYNNIIDSINNGATNTGTFYAWQYISGGYTVNFYNNLVNRIYAPVASAIYGAYPYYYATNFNMYNNTFSNFTGGTTVYGVYEYGYYFQNFNFYNNTIKNITSAAGGTIYGAYLYYSAITSANLYKNSIVNLTVPSGAGTIHGVYVYNSSYGAPSNMPVKLYNNLIGNFNNVGGTGSPSVIGINFNYVSYNYFGQASYNTIYLNGALGANGSSACIYVGNATPRVKLNNNILSNNMTVSGTGVASAIQRISATYTTYDNTSNNNVLYAGTPSLYHVLNFDGTNKDQTVAAYNARVAPAEGSSLAENVTFLSTSTLSADYLKIDSTIVTGIESGAVNIAGITDDYAGKIRQGNTGYAGTGNAPDIGAFEGNYTMNDVIAPIFAVTPTVANTASTGDRVITVNISDNTGISTRNLSFAPYLPPVLYYKKSMLGSFSTATGSKVSGNGKNGMWSFTLLAMNLGGSLSIGDSVYYFIVAQDSSINTNLGSAPSGASGTDVNSIYTYPSSLYSYKIVPGMSGTYNVGGPSFNFYNLTNPGGAFDVINNSALSGNVTLRVSGDLNESGAVTLKKWSESGAGNYNVKIVPDGTTERLIVDTLASNATAVITFDGCSRATFDGRYNGSGKYLRIRNRATGGYDFGFKNDATLDTVQYCNIECVNNTVGSITFGGSNVVGGRGNDSNVICYNNIGDTLGAIAPAGASNTCVSSSGTVGLENDANVISYNNMYNFAYNVVNLTNGGTGNYWTIYGNNIYQTANRTTSSTYFMFPVSQGYGHIFRKNSIGGAAPDRSGIPINNLGNYWYVFYQTAGNISIPNVYDSNTIANMNTPYLYPIYISAGAATVTNNIIGGKQNPWDTIVASGQVYGIYLAGNGNMIADKNTISNITYTGGATGYLIGIQAASYGAINTISNNTIRDITGNGTGALPTTMYNSGICLYNTSVGGTVNVDNNTVYNISNTGSGFAAGIGIYYAYSPMNITRNKVYGITSSSNFTEGIYGPYYNYASINFANNQVSLAPNGNLGSVIGMHDASYYGGTSNNYYNNSVFVGGSAGSTSAANSYAFFRNGTGGIDAIDVRNNILYNKRSGGTGSNYAVGYTNGSVITPASINYNLMAVTDTSKVMELPSATATGVNGVNAIYAGSYNSSWMARTADIPAQTLFADTAVANLNIVTANANSWYANGKGIAIAAVTNDYAGTARSTSIAAGATDLGAFEFSTGTTPPAATASAAPALNTSTNYTFAGRKVASITWGATGTVPTSVAVNYYTGTTAPSLLASKTQFNSYFAITPTGGSAYTYSLSMNYDSSMFGNVSSTGNARMARYKSPNWNNVTTSSASSNGGMLSSGASFAATTLPANFTGTDNSNPLPVNLVNIFASRRENDAVINWSTASEMNCAYFEVERSFDENEFEYAGSVRAIGNSNKLITYSFNDAGIIPAATTGVIYYRLKMVDFDGATNYSKTVSINSNELQNADQVSIYPNPFNNKLNLMVNATAAGSANVQLFDITGKKLVQFNHAIILGLNKISTEQIADLQTGIYFITVELNGQTQTFKLIKE